MCLLVTSSTKRIDCNKELNILMNIATQICNLNFEQETSSTKEIREEKQTKDF